MKCLKRTPRNKQKSAFRIVSALFLFVFSTTICRADPSESQQQLNLLYQHASTTPSDIYEHVPVLRSLAQQCSSIVEIGLRTMVSSWGILQGLSENPSPSRSYLGIDIEIPPIHILNLARKLTESNGILFNFWHTNDIDIDIPPTEMLFIDSLHRYCHLTNELEKFSPRVSKYIAMHDTSAPWGEMDESSYGGNFSYPIKCDPSKSGLWPAVSDFLLHHPEWTLHQRLLNNHGFTVLKRIKDNHGNPIAVD